MFDLAIDFNAVAEVFVVCAAGLSSKVCVGTAGLDVVQFVPV